MYKIIKVRICEMPYIVLWVLFGSDGYSAFPPLIHYIEGLLCYDENKENDYFSLLLVRQPHLDIVFSSAHHSLKKMLITWSKSREGLPKWWKY